MFGFLWNELLINPITNLLVVLYHLFLTLRLPGAFGWAIIGLTIIIRFILQPFFRKQRETAQKMQELKPQLDELTRRHKGDRTRLQQEQAKLFKTSGVNPAGGCLLLIIQIPIFIALYKFRRI